MPQELTDAEWLKDMATRFNFEQRGWSDRLRSIAAKLERGAVESGVTAEGWAVVTHYQGPRHFSEVHLTSGTKAERDIAVRSWPSDCSPEIVPVKITEITPAGPGGGKNEH